MKLSLALLGLITFSLPISFAQADEHSALKPVPRTGGWMTRHESFNKRVSQGKVDLVFIGDSITQGWEGAGKSIWQEFYGGRNAVNLGIGGDRTQHVIWRLDNGNFKDITPKAAVIMIGTNNSGANSSQEIADGITKIVKQIRNKSPKTKILLLAVFPRGATKDDGRRKVNEGANALVSKLDDGKHVHYLDIGPNFLKEDLTLPRDIMPDLLHLSPAGYKIWAESIEAKLATLLNDK